MTKVQGRKRDPSPHIESALKIAEDAGYVVHKRKSWESLLEKLRRARCDADSQREWRESNERYAQTTLHNEIRELQARCTALYGAARAHGATADELANIAWPTTGINCPHSYVCLPDMPDRNQHKTWCRALFGGECTCETVRRLEVELGERESFANGLIEKTIDEVNAMTPEQARVAFDNTEIGQILREKPNNATPETSD